MAGLISGVAIAGIIILVIYLVQRFTCVDFSKIHTTCGGKGTYASGEPLWHEGGTLYASGQPEW